MLLRVVQTLAGLLVLGALSACGGDAEEIPADRVEEQIVQHMADIGGVEPDEVSCPEGILAEEGEEVDCTLTADGEEYAVNVEVTGVDGDVVDFHITFE